MSYRGQSIVTLEAATTPAQIISPVLLLETGRVATEDAAFVTVDVSANVPAGATVLLVEFLAATTVAADVGTVVFKGRGVGLTSGGPYNDGSEAVIPPVDDIYAIRVLWLPTNAAREFEYQRVNPNAGNAFWRLYLRGYQ